VAWSEGVKHERNTTICSIDHFLVELTNLQTSSASVIAFVGMRSKKLAVDSAVNVKKQNKKTIDSAVNVKKKKRKRKKEEKNTHKNRRLAPFPFSKFCKHDRFLSSVYKLQTLRALE